jgi:flagellar biosynthetic protein FliO
VQTCFNSISVLKRRIVVFAALLVLGGTVVLIGRSNSVTQPINQENIKLNKGTTPMDEGSFSKQFANNLGNQELFFKMTISIILVIVLGGLGLYLSKRFLPRITNAPGKEIHVLETAYLGSKKAVHLVEVGNQRFLIGSTEERITTLADVTETAPDLTIQQQDIDMI